MIPIIDYWITFSTHLKMEEPQQIKFTSNPIVTTPHVTTSTSSIVKNSCTWINERGAATGESCDKPVLDEGKYCTAHKAVDLRRKRNASKDKPQENPPRLLTGKPPLTIDEDSEDSEEETEEQHLQTVLSEKVEVSDIQIISILQAVVTILAQIRLK